MPRTTARKRPPKPYEAPDMAAFMARTLRAMVRRAAGADLEVLTALQQTQAVLDEAMAGAVTALRENGYSWADIGRELGTSRQAAQMRYGVK